MIHAIFERYVPKEFIHIFSIDECFLDITGSHLLFSSTEEIVRKIQRDILEELKLFVTIGIVDNPLLATLALDNEAKHQESGIVESRYEDVLETIWKIKQLDDVCGIWIKSNLLL
ncbi:hypothetical protein RVZ54_002095 [Listeria monocytogenes]|nr:hypothetical protein [Listeria monocytogenes]ELK7957727.1 hypothetical protein [Listeria monocytogenes]ELK8003513.1 hypothetical protein [Listeria monocytogenes]ELK8010867.1 hypothetical protein [Listeria monocytogenes]ELK8013748.1 hypothetical protein [Listeria monocytogenes]